jgi:hypothetical protein
MAMESQTDDTPDDSASTGVSPAICDWEVKGSSLQHARSSDSQ